MPTGWIADDNGDNDRERPVDGHFIKGDVKLVLLSSDKVTKVLAVHAIDIENRSNLNGTGQGPLMLGIQSPSRF